MDYSPPGLGFPREEYWSELPLLSLGDLPNSEIKPTPPVLAGKFFFLQLSNQETPTDY